MKQVEYTDGVIRIRPYRLEDLESLFAAATESVATVGAWLPWCHVGYKREEAEAYITMQIGQWERSECFEFAITDVSSGRYLGGGGINRYRPELCFANLGYWMRQSEHGKGYCTRAVRLIAGFGFTELGLKAIEIVVRTDNIASLRVAEKAGAKREGVLRNRLRAHGVVYDAVMHSLIPEDLAA